MTRGAGQGTKPDKPWCNIIPPKTSALPHRCKWIKEPVEHMPTHSPLRTRTRGDRSSGIVPSPSTGLIRHIDPSIQLRLALGWTAMTKKQIKGRIVECGFPREWCFKREIADEGIAHWNASVTALIFLYLVNSQGWVMQGLGRMGREIGVKGEY